MLRLGRTGYRALSLLRVVFIEFGDGLLNVFERPADGLRDFTGYFLMEFESWCGRLGILEPEDGFSGGCVLAGWCAFGGTGVY